MRQQQQQQQSEWSPSPASSPSLSTSTRKITSTSERNKTAVQNNEPQRLSYACTLSKMASGTGCACLLTCGIPFCERDTHALRLNADATRSMTRKSSRRKRDCKESLTADQQRYVFSSLSHGAFDSEKTTATKKQNKRSSLISLMIGHCNRTHSPLLRRNQETDYKNSCSSILISMAFYSLSEMSVKAGDSQRSHLTSYKLTHQDSLIHNHAEETDGREWRRERHTHSCVNCCFCCCCVSVVPVCFHSASWDRKEMSITYWLSWTMIEARIAYLKVRHWVLCSSIRLPTIRRTTNREEKRKWHVIEKKRQTLTRNTGTGIRSSGTRQDTDYATRSTQGFVNLFPNYQWKSEVNCLNECLKLRCHFRSGTLIAITLFPHPFVQNINYPTFKISFCTTYVRVICVILYLLIPFTQPSLPQYQMNLMRLEVTAWEAMMKMMMSFPPVKKEEKIKLKNKMPSFEDSEDSRLLHDLWCLPSHLIP